MVAHSIVQGRVSVTLGKAGPAQTRENGHLPKGIAVLTELVIYYCELYVEDFGGGEIQKDTRVKLRLWRLGARSKCS